MCANVLLPYNKAFPQNLGTIAVVDDSVVLNVTRRGIDMLTQFVDSIDGRFPNVRSVKFFQLSFHISRDMYILSGYNRLTEVASTVFR